MSRKIILIAAAVVIVIGGAVAYFLTRGTQGTSTESAPAPEAAQAPSGPTPEPHILVMDRGAIFQYSKVGQDIGRQVQALSTQAQNDLGGERRALEAEGKQLQEQAASLSPDDRQKRVAAFEAKQQAFEKQVQQRQAQIQQALAQARQAVAQTLQPILKEELQQRGGNIVLDKQAVPMATSAEFDITPDVIKALDAKMTAYRIQQPNAAK
ncbi:MAG TPA: OmpH family outer membrane protein [Rhizomicrobium sp.]|jgi:outer membrane protein|nr:OmpH family outer membrane protein [Rhizomicrobium sp.]